MKRLVVLSLFLLSAGTGARAQEKEKTFDGWKEAVIWISRPSSNIQASAKGSPFAFDLDFAMQGALALADRSISLSTQPKGLRLGLEEPNPMLVVRTGAGELKFALAGDSKAQITNSIKIDEGKVPFKLLVRQLDQVALYAISPDLKNVLQVWCGKVDYKIKLRSADIYELCENVEVRVGERKFEAKDLPGGLVLDHLDELGDIVIKGLDPQKKPFLHRYTFDATSVEPRLNEAFQTIYPGREEKEKSKGEEKPKGGETKPDVS